jgi:hypothetical protein
MLIIVFQSMVHAQWPISTLTDSALVINYGFRAHVVTFADGSSIFSHGLENTVYVQKFDPEGYRVWPGIVVAHDDNSSDFSGGSLIVSDGSGGAVVGWEDHRGAYWDPNIGIYRNNAFYVQRVDSDGNLLWPPGGVLAEPPDSGANHGTILTDGSGGVIYVAEEFGFLYPGAPDRERLMAVRIGGNGEKLWDVTLEASTDGDDLFLMDADRAGRYIYVKYLDYRNSTLGQYFTWVIDTSGVAALDSIWESYFANVAWNDSVLFRLGGNPATVSKIGPQGDTLWCIPFEGDTCQYILPFFYTVFVPDGLGGGYYLCVDQDSLSRFNSRGEVSRTVFQGIGDIGGYAFTDNAGGMVLANDDGEAQRYDSTGTALWDSEPIIYQSDPENSYAEDFWGDNNGGIIATFWTTSHGLSAQHTGRYGQPGTVPVVVSTDQFPGYFKLMQNYPNPFNPITHIVYSVSRRSSVRLRLYDVLGRELLTFVNRVEEAGHHTVEWNAGTYPSGVYFCRFEVDGTVVQTRKMILMR